MTVRKWLLAGLSVTALTAPAAAQDYGASYDAPPPQEAPPLLPQDVPGEVPPAARAGGSAVRTDIQPYVELNQVVFTGTGADSDVVTYTTVAAGVDAPDGDVVDLAGYHRRDVHDARHQTVTHHIRSVKPVHGDPLFMLKKA